MSIINRFKPKFWDHHDAAAGAHTTHFSFRRKWKLIVVMTSIVTLTPLAIMMLIDSRIPRQSMEAEMSLRTSQLVSNTWRTVSFFLTERKSAMKFVLRDNNYRQLNDPKRLASLLASLRESIGGFVDMGIVDASGRLTAYAGPYGLEGAELAGEACFKQVVKSGEFISHLEIDGLRQAGKLVVAIRQELPDASFFVLRAALDTEPLNDLLAQLEIGESDDAFLIDSQGVLQTPARHHGRVLDKIDLPVPQPASRTTVVETTTPEDEPVLLGYASIPDTSLTLMVLRQKSGLMTIWYKPRIALVGLLVLCLGIVFCAILAMATFVVHRIHVADQKRITALHRVEYANKLTAIERLAAGLAHEINNPLAVINQNAGLIKDLFQIREQYARDDKLIALLTSIISSVDRCGKITKRLLNFSRHIEVVIEPVDVGELIQGLIDVIAKDAEHKDIAILLTIPDALPSIESDPSHLQQIFLNLFNNSFAAIGEHGRLETTVTQENASTLSVIIEDDGCGIPEEDLKHIFDPFFTTKAHNEGTGLGLSITHGLIQKIGGRIDVHSNVGEGTRFTLFLPMRPPAYESTDKGVAL